MIGRLVAQALLEWFNHRKLLLGSIVLAMSGYLVLSFVQPLSVRYLAVALIGAGYAPIYPLIAERLDDRFSYHPGFLEWHHLHCHTGCHVCAVDLGLCR